MYTQLCVKRAENPTEEVSIDERLIAVVNKMFQRCFEDKKYKQVSFEMCISYKINIVENFHLPKFITNKFI